MLLPIPNNETCDIYRNGSAIGSPDVANVPCHLTGDYFRHTESGEGDPMYSRFTHTILVPAGTDIRDGYGTGAYNSNFDTVGIPAGAAGAATIFNVIFVEAKAVGTTQLHLKVYLDRQTPQWPTTAT